MPNDLQIRIQSTDPRLRRHIDHDSRSGLYRLDTSGLAVTDVEWSMHVGILNQGQVGKCTAEAATETLASDPFYSTLPADLVSDFANGDADTFSDGFYSAEESLDGDGPYPPIDNGSSGLTSAKVAKARSLISGYLHTFSTEDAIKGLQTGPAQWGTLWKTGMDAVNTKTGQVKYTGTTRGGHEMCLYKVVAAKEQIWFRQSWGPWGYKGLGVGWISFDDFDASLADQGDIVFFQPLGTPAPTPSPAPAAGVTRTFPATSVELLDEWAAKDHKGEPLELATAWRSGS